MKKVLIGLAGAARSGKDTAAQFLVEQGFQRMSFATPLKRGVAAILGEPDAACFDDALKDVPIWEDRPTHVTRRRLMQAIGTEGVRNHVDPRFWIWLAEKDYSAMTAPVVISDVRFFEEADWVRRVGGFIWHLKRNTRSDISGISNHESEAGVEILMEDFTLWNNGSLEHLGYQVRQQLRWMKEERLL